MQWTQFQAEWASAGQFVPRHIKRDANRGALKTSLIFTDPEIHGTKTHRIWKLLCLISSDWNSQPSARGDLCNLSRLSFQPPHRATPGRIFMLAQDLRIEKPSEKARRTHITWEVQFRWCDWAFVMVNVLGEQMINSERPDILLCRTKQVSMDEGCLFVST